MNLKELKKVKDSVELTPEDYEEIGLSAKEVKEIASGLGVSPADVGSWFAGSDWSKFQQDGAKNVFKALEKILTKEEIKSYEHDPRLLEVIQKKLREIRGRRE